MRMPVHACLAVVAGSAAWTSMNTGKSRTVEDLTDDDDQCCKVRLEATRNQRDAT